MEQALELKTLGPFGSYTGAGLAFDVQAQNYDIAITQINPGILENPVGSCHVKIWTKVSIWFSIAQTWQILKTQRL